MQTNPFKQFVFGQWDFLIYRYFLDFCEKYNLRWRIAVNLLSNLRTAFGSSIDIHSPNSALI
jgi:hypothetical protein